MPRFLLAATEITYGPVTHHRSPWVHTAMHYGRGLTMTVCGTYADQLAPAPEGTPADCPACIAR